MEISQKTLKENIHYNHRLAFLYMTGRFPKDEIDHINHIKDDNRWCNLRECTRSKNMMNSLRYKNNKSGYKGVSWHGKIGRWRSQIRINFQNKDLGHFNCKHEAAKKYNEKAKELFGNFAYQNEIIK